MTENLGEDKKTQKVDWPALGIESGVSEIQATELPSSVDLDCLKYSICYTTLGSIIIVIKF